jgi:4-hydroxyacetophenone monooxygenase
LLAHVPYYSRWHRFLVFWPGSDGLMPSLIVDPRWPHQERSINAANEQTRIFLTQWIQGQIGDDPDLLEKVLPKYPPYGKRILQDNGSWFAALKSRNVALVTAPIREIFSRGIRCENGEDIELDAIVYATGFHANRFLWPMEIRGRNGAVLNEQWGDDPRAYLGITVPNFPNLFCLYGPGTNLAHAGSIIFHSECQVRYIMGCIQALVERDLTSMECRQEVCDRFNERLAQRLAALVWSHPGVRNWYKNAAGRVTTTSPWKLVEYWGWTKSPDLADFHLR